MEILEEIKASLKIIEDDIVDYIEIEPIQMLSQLHTALEELSRYIETKKLSMEASEEAKNIYDFLKFQEVQILLKQDKIISTSDFNNDQRQTIIELFDIVKKRFSSMYQNIVGTVEYTNNLMSIRMQIQMPPNPTETISGKKKKQEKTPDEILREKKIGTQRLLVDSFKLDIPTILRGKGIGILELREIDSMEELEQVVLHCLYFLNDNNEKTHIFDFHGSSPNIGRMNNDLSIRATKTGRPRPFFYVFKEDILTARFIVRYIETINKTIERMVNWREDSKKNNELEINRSGNFIEVSVNITRPMGGDVCEAISSSEVQRAVISGEKDGSKLERVLVDSQEITIVLRFEERNGIYKHNILTIFPVIK